MKGINVNPVSVVNSNTTPPVLSDFQAIAAAGAQYVRAELQWAVAQPTEGSIDSSWATAVDNLVANCANAGLYVWLNLEAGVDQPSWVSEVGPTGSLQNLENNGQYWVQYLANRYGNSSSPEYSRAVMGIGINEPIPDYNDADDWVTTLIGEQATILGWARASGYAPQWIVSIAAGGGSGCAMLPNVSGSGQTLQTFVGASTAPIPGGNFMLEVHDPVKVATTNTSAPYFPSNDGRNTTYGFIGPDIVEIGDTTYVGYPPAVTGVTQADMTAGMAAWWANYEFYASSEQANCPIYVAEGNWDPVVNNTGPGGGFGAQYITDKLSLWAGLNPVPAMIGIWQYGTSQSADDFAMRPGTGPGIVGATPDGWTYYADAFFSSSAVLYRVLQQSGAWYRIT
jgi:hypothetical protein